MVSVESGASCGASFPVDRETVRSPSFFLSRFSRGRAVSPTARASHGNVMQITTGTRWARTGNVSASRRARSTEAAPGKAARVEPAARRDGFQDYYAVKSHLAGASWRDAGTRAFRSEIARCHAGGPRVSRPYPRRPRRGAAGRSAPGAGRRDVGPYHRSQPRSHPSHVPAPATSPPQPRSSPSHVPVPATFPPQPRSSPSHVPAPATSPPQPRSSPATFPPWFWRRSRAPRRGIGWATRLCAVWVLRGERPRHFPQGPEMFFPSRLLGSGGKSG